MEPQTIVQEQVSPLQENTASKPLWVKSLLVVNVIFIFIIVGELFRYYA